MIIIIVVIIIIYIVQQMQFTQRHDTDSYDKWAGTAKLNI